ncbi:MAG: U32 family peptidase [Desulfobacterota bacterium]|nr:U32 family peptidase [Thermodesulfobacteriota bacterium]
MKILSPLDSADEVDKLAAAGADEFYCGLLEEQWYERYPVISINRRPAGKGHFKDFKTLKDAVAKAHDAGTPVYFTINEHYYVREQYPLIIRYIEGACEAGIDAFIVSDVGLMAFLRSHGYSVPLHISTGGTVFNWRSVAFYRDLGAVNITLPRHLTIEEIKDIVNTAPPVAMTVFILNSRCINVDGFCTFQHGLARRDILPMFRNACMLPFDITLHDAKQTAQQLSYADEARIIERQRVWEKVHVDDYPCGACALYEFQTIGIGSVKIVGRGNPIERKITDVRFLKELLNVLEHEQPSRKAFRKKARQTYTETYKRPCRIALCYYPSVMLDEG